MATKREMFNLIATRNADDAEIVAFCEHEIQLLDAKKTSKTPTKTQKANEALIGQRGSSAEHPDREDSEIAEYEYLQPVEVLNLGKWEPGHYIDVDRSLDSLGVPHCVVLDGTREVEWYSDEDVRPAQK